MPRAWPLRVPPLPARPEAVQELGFGDARAEAVFLEGFSCEPSAYLQPGPMGALFAAAKERLPQALGELPPRWRRALEEALAADAPALRLRRGTLPLGQRTYVMGIVNVTPDSFADGGRYAAVEAAVAQALALEEQGADIIDVGGESTRPGAKAVALDEELRRVVPVLEELRGRLRVPLSIDTYKWPVAERALALGADIVNDITAGVADPLMLGGAASAGAAVVLMHTQAEARYERLGHELRTHLSARAEAARAAGVRADAIVLDPGIGFGKEPEHSFSALRMLGSLRALGYPVLLGASRKRFIGAATGKGASDRLHGTLAALALGVALGADIVRVHDVAAAVDAVRVADRTVRG